MEQSLADPIDRAPEQIRRVTVYASSSNALDPAYYDAAARLGTVLGRAGLDIIYGGGGVGLMRAMADNALAAGAHVHGVIPHFLNTVEHGHKSLSRLEVVADMRERKQRMIADSNAVISLPGGSGTFEEVFEALTLKRLDLFIGPIVLVNTIATSIPVGRKRNRNTPPKSSGVTFEETARKRSKHIARPMMPPKTP